MLVEAFSAWGIYQAVLHLHAPIKNTRGLVPKSGRTVEVGHW